MALYQEDKEEVVLSKTAADLETSQILNSSKLNETITKRVCLSAEGTSSRA